MSNKISNVFAIEKQYGSNDFAIESPADFGDFRRFLSDEFRVFCAICGKHCLN